MPVGAVIETIEPGRYRVRETPTHYIEVVRQLFNWRVVSTPKDEPWGWDRGWCYFGTGEDIFAKAVLAAVAWDGSDDTEPPGYDRALGIALRVLLQD